MVNDSKRASTPLKSPACSGLALDSGNAGDVIRLVTNEAEYFDDLFRRHAEFFHDSRFVDDLIVSHYFKRLTMIDMSLGDADFHLARFSDAPGVEA